MKKTLTQIRLALAMAGPRVNSTAYRLLGFASFALAAFAAICIVQLIVKRIF